MEGQFDDLDQAEEYLQMMTKTNPIQEGCIDSNTNIADDDDNWSDDNYMEMDEMYTENCRGNGAKYSSNQSYQPVDKMLSKFSDKIHLDAYEHPSIPQHNLAQVRQMDKRMVENKNRVKDKSDRATIEQVMDPRTRIILFKMLSRGVIKQINGVISTGKEANVYHATNQHGEDRALKIYKTSILTFKDRDRYVTGEFRFRRGYCKGNPRKMVATWAEKEMRNLTRMHQAGLPCPEPLMLRSHVLLMSFIGTDGWPAPLLKDAALSESKSRELYFECIHLVRRMYHDCKLVHADFSEYNILYHDGGLIIIDVSQSVEHDHPHALNFLRKDCNNVNEFFKKKGVAVMNLRELFEFVTDVDITEENIDSYLDNAMKITSERVSTLEQKDEEEQNADLEEQIFKQVFIPRTLDEVPNFERDVDAVMHTGDDSHILYRSVTGMNVKLSKSKTTGSDEDEDDNSEDSDNESSKSAEDENQSEISTSSSCTVCVRNMTKEEKRLHKQKVKEENREKRNNKVPKHIKKRKEKLAKLRKPKT
uniref:serine/threonine-protein kinase RIO1-like isoform X1 n=1 Tax=Styela clava TaxID=7725 RepID=UPI001939A43B|nr:serine/threonine-protein kinase RIO1-like isoform X1 [Styela clava]